MWKAYTGYRTALKKQDAAEKLVTASKSAFDAVLGHFFPTDRAMFTKIAAEQAMSRLYGGIHYRFDNDIGLELGRAVARHAIEREKRGGLDAWRTAGAVRKP